MGADAEVFVFDYQRYRDEVVPALLEVMRTGQTQPWLAELIAPSSGDDVLAALKLRGQVLGHTDCGSDGIHGWLTPEETNELATRLSRLPLPGYPATVEAMAHYRRVLPEGGTYYAADGVDGDELMLSFVRTMAAIAAESRQGVLWGNDVIPGLWQPT